MISAFVDSSVLFAASLSPGGASHEILQQGIRGEVVLIISDLVLEEVRRNLSAKRPDAVSYLEAVVEAVQFQLVNPNRSEVMHAAQYTALKDAPIVAAAIRAGVDYLVSLDRRHLVGQTKVARESRLEIVLPVDLVHRIQQQSDSL